MKLLCCVKASFDIRGQLPEDPFVGIATGAPYMRYEIGSRVPICVARRCTVLLVSC